MTALARRLRAALAVVAGGIALGLALVLLAGQLGVFQGHPPADLGVRDGRLKAPSLTPNSVSSQARQHPGHPQQAYSDIAPLTLRGEPPQAMARLAQWLTGQPRWRVLVHEDRYLRAEAHTRWLRFVDDVEFWAQPGADPGWTTVHVRSASRLGRRDLGANRARIERLRAHLSAQENPSAAEKDGPPLTGY